MARSGAGTGYRAGWGVAHDEPHRPPDPRGNRRGAAGNDQRLWSLVESHQRFVAGAAHALRNRAVPFDDLRSEGNLGLVEAARRFDEERGARFLTYAAWWVRKRMLHAIAHGRSLVSVSDYQLRRRDAGERGAPGARSSHGARRRGSAELLGEPSLRWPATDLSLDQGLGSAPLSASLADPLGETPEGIVIRRQARLLVRGLLGALPPRQREVLALRFGLDGGEPATLEETGARIGLTRERVRQIERQALEQLRRGLVAAPRRGGPRSPHGGAKGRALGPPGNSGGEAGGGEPRRGHAEPKLPAAC